MRLGVMLPQKPQSSGYQRAAGGRAPAVLTVQGGAAAEGLREL